MLAPAPQQEALQLVDDRIAEALAKGHYVTVLRYDKPYTCPNTGAWVGSIDLFVASIYDVRYAEAEAAFGNKRLAESGKSEGQSYIVLAPPRPLVDEVRSRRRSQGR